MNGKGSRPRPREIDHSTWSDNWDRIFGPKKDQEQASPPPAIESIEEIPITDEDTEVDE